MRSRPDERRAEVGIANFPLQRLAQRVTVERDAEALAIETLGR